MILYPPPSLSLYVLPSSFPLSLLTPKSDLPSSSSTSPSSFLLFFSAGDQIQCLVHAKQELCPSPVPPGPPSFVWMLCLHVQCWKVRLLTTEFCPDWQHPSLPAIPSLASTLGSLALPRPWHSGIFWLWSMCMILSLSYSSGLGTIHPSQPLLPVPFSSGKMLSIYLDLASLQ